MKQEKKATVTRVVCTLLSCLLFAYVDQLLFLFYDDEGLIEFIMIPALIVKVVIFSPIVLSYFILSFISEDKKTNKMFSVRGIVLAAVQSVSAFYAGAEAGAGMEDFLFLAAPVAGMWGLYFLERYLQKKINK